MIRRLPLAIILIIIGAHLAIISTPAPYDQSIDLELIEEVFIENDGDKHYPLRKLINLSLCPNSTSQISSLRRVLVDGDEVKWGEVKIDEDENPYVEIDISRLYLGPGENISLRVETRIRIFRRALHGPVLSVNNSLELEDIPSPLREKYTRKTGLFQVNNEKLREIALNLKGNTTNVLEIVLKFLNWTEYHIKYPFEVSGELRLPSYPNETLEAMIGDCDDQSNLLVTLCRIAGIPAITQVGYIFEPDRSFSGQFSGRYRVTLRNVGAHAWALVYIPPWGWIPVDPTFFKGAKIVEGYIRSEDPLDHILSSAFMMRPVIVGLNIVNSDYVSESREWAKELYDYNLTWYECVELKEVVSEKITTGVRTLAPVPKEYDRLAVIMLALSTLMISIILFSARILSRRSF
ncbi:hypothetical protein DRN86_00225 [Candidatus Geothermarchaeota archaeon]|nr:MAG: hypothetical protein DRN86_00225 [Candidatus Geothermarchaeota archaeon]